MDVVTYFRWAETNFNSGRVSLGRDLDDPGWAPPVPINKGAHPDLKPVPPMNRLCPTCKQFIGEFSYEKHTQEHIREAQERVLEKAVEKAEKAARKKRPPPWEEDDEDERIFRKAGRAAVEEQARRQAIARPRYAVGNCPLEKLPQDLRDRLILEVQVEMALRKALHKKHKHIGG